LIPVEIGVFTVDADLVVRTWDAWMETHTGIAAAAACGRPLGEVVPSLVERGLIQRFAQVVSSGEVQVLAPAFHHYLVPCAPRQASPNFAQMQQRATLGPLREDNRIVGVMATIEDVTVRIDRERQLAASLRADDWKVRRSAVDELSREARPEMLASLVTALRNEHRNFNVLSSALQLLSASDLDLTAPLAALLREPDADLRIQAALALGERQTAGAIEALGRMHAADAVDALADIAEGDDFFLVFPAIDALAKMHDARVAPRLIPLLRRNDVTEAVADALAGLGSADAVRPLVGVLNTTGPAAPIARALAQIYERYESRYGGGALIAAEFQAAIRPPGAQRLLDALATTVVPDLSGLVTVVGWLRGPAVEQALARLLGQAAVRPAVIEAIVRQDGGIVDLLIDQLGGEDADVRLSTIVALGRLGDGRATPALTAMLAGDRAEIVAAASALARIGDVSAFEALLPLLAHADSTVRQAAIGALNSLGHPDMAARVCDLLSSPDSRVRESAVRIAGYFGYPECSEAVVRLASDTDEAVRRAAVEHLPFLDDPRAAPSLVAALADRSGRVRAAAAQALAHMPRPAADAALIEASADADAWVRYYAVRSLGTLGDPAVLPRLAAIAASDPAMHVRIAAVESVGAIGGDPAADILLRYASSEDADLASAALRSLGRTSHAEAVAAMREALRSGDPPRRLAAVTGLRACVSREAVDVLQWTAVADSEDSVALAAVEALGAIAGKSDRQADAAVAALVATLAEPSRRVAAVAVLSRLPERQIARVAAGLTHPNPLVRRVLVDVLARLRHPEASAAIRGALDDADAAVREAAIVALDQLAVRGIRPRLAQLAQSDESRAVRRAAASALGRSTDGPDAQADGIA
jgi:HEAT repeat protein